MVQSLPGAVLSCFAKKVPKEATWRGAERIAPAIRVALLKNPLGALLSFLQVIQSISYELYSSCEVLPA